MATRRNTRKSSMRAPAKASAAVSRSSRHSTTPRKQRAELDSGESSDDNESNDTGDQDDEENDPDSDDEPSGPALSGFYPFEFDNDGSLTGTDDEMDTTTIPATNTGSEFEKAMEIADMHATLGAQDSDGENYDAVDDIDDEDEDDDEMMQGEDDANVLRAAEKDLIAEFVQTEHTTVPAATSGTRRVSFAGLDDDDIFHTASVNFNDDPFQGARFMDETWGSLWENAELGIWRKPGEDGEMQDPARNPRSKKVRFQETTVRAASSDDSSSDSDDDEAEQQFPDIFMDQADPKIQLLLANDSEADWTGFNAQESDAESVYDFEDDADRFAFEMDEDSESDADESSDSEDDGDETEDETVEEQQAKMQKFRKEMASAFGQSQPSTPQTSKSTPVSKSSTKRPITPRSSNGPRQGVFVCDPTKATLTTDRSTRKTILYPPAKPTPQHKAFWERAKSVTNKTADSPVGAIAIPAGNRDPSPERPFTAKATLGSMFDGRMDVFEAEPAPLTQAQPFPLFGVNTMASFSSAADEASDMDAEYPAEFSTMLNMENFEDDSSDTDMATSGVSSQPAFLSQSGVVSSFRLNQHRAKIESSLPSNPAKRASTAEYNALQSGRRGAGNAPITPARKRRSNSQDMFRTGSGVKKNITPAYNSPLAARRRHSRGQSLSGRLDQTLTPEMWKKV